MRPPTSSRRVLEAAFVALCLSTAPAAAAGDPPDAAALRRTVADGSASAEARAAAALLLSRTAPAELGSALRDLAARGEAGDLPFLRDYAVGEEARHLRLLAVHAAAAASPEKTAEAFLDRAGDPDVKRAMRAIEAAGFAAGLAKDRAPFAARFLELAAAPRIFPALEAIRAFGRVYEKKQEKALVEAILEAGDEHRRRHLCWVLGDHVGTAKAPKLFDRLLKAPGARGERAAAARRIFIDASEPEWEWNPAALRDLPALGEARAAAGGRVEFLGADGPTRAKLASFLEEMDTATPAWGDLVHLVARNIAVMPMKAESVFEPRTRTLYIAPFEMDSCNKPWQGAYVLARNASVALGVLLGEPDGAHRGWETGCIEVHSFLKTSGHELAPFEKYVEDTLGKLVRH